MKKLDMRIQREDNLNVIEYEDIVGPGNGRHNYIIKREDTGEVICQIQFQNGGRNEAGAIAGVLESDLLEIVRHRLQCFQSGQFASRENACAITHIEEALMWQNKRKEDRKARGVLGSQKE
ncbi:MAG TPA: ABC transporter ATPase [Candidatus Pelethenecus sp.]|nr:ABC transporter ATPase [Candidatus Pelethenecus sp.]